MGRLSQELRERAEIFGDRMLDVVRVLEKRRVYARVIDQMVGCGTSVGANACEADQAMSRPDFCKALGVVVKELSESRYWLRTCTRRGWIPADRLSALIAESDELSKIFGRMIAKSKVLTKRARSTVP
jgi:four helix bundle protein